MHNQNARLQKKTGATVEVFLAFTAAVKMLQSNSFQWNETKTFLSKHQRFLDQIITAKYIKNEGTIALERNDSTDVATCGDRDHHATLHDHPGAVHREVGGRGRHLQVSAQLQRSPTDLLGTHQQLRLQTPEHLEPGLKIREYTNLF